MHYVMSDVVKNTKTEVIKPKVRKFSDADEARAYAILVMNRLGKRSWNVYSDARCTHFEYIIERRKNYYNVWDTEVNKDYMVRADGKIIIPDYNTGRPYWGQGTPKKLKPYYINDSEARDMSSAKLIMAEDVWDFRRKILEENLTLRYYYAYRGKTLIGYIEVRGGTPYWTDFRPDNPAGAWGSAGEITPSGDARYSPRKADIRRGLWR